MEAISQAGAVIGVLSKDGIALAAEKKISSKLLDTQAVGVRREKMYRIDDHMACAVAGLTADANILINQCRLAAQRYLALYGEPMPCEQLVKLLCDLKQAYTQSGGKRPFGVSLIYAGWDKRYGFQLYQSDPSGNFGGWKATAVGANHQAATNLLKTDYKDGCTLDEGIKLVLHVMAKTMDSALSSDKVELATLTRDPETGKMMYRIYEADQMQSLLDAANEQKEASRS